MGAHGSVIALAGNPNSGKTSLFNFITGSRQHVGNYPGVTVEKKEGTVRVDDTAVTFLDLPGTYSLSPYSPEERIAMSEIVSDSISGIIVVVDTTRLSRNLFLVSQIIETGKPVVLALNMFDEFGKSGGELDIDCLSEILGVPCVKTVGNRGKGVTELMSIALKAVRGEVPAVGKPFRYSHETEHAIDTVGEVIRGKVPFNERWAAINLLNFGDTFPEKSLHASLSKNDYASIAEIRGKLETLEGRDINSIIVSGRYGFSAGITAECLTEKDHEALTVSDRVDAVLTHRFLGIPIFLFVLWIMFQGTFTLGEIPVAMIESLFALLGGLATVLIPDGFFQSLVVDGIIAGVGGVLVFLPNILLLFFFISLLEDSGYMARAAFIMDRIMHAAGLHGKSFIPMLVGFGCSVPAIMATRTLENRRDRYITMFIIPFMSCGAKLPVYILLAGAFFSPQTAGNVIFSIYLIGVALAFIVAKSLSFFIRTSTSFVMELPPYRIPTMRSVLLHLWERAWMYLKKAGTIILAFAILIWVLTSYPTPPESSEKITTTQGYTTPVTMDEISYSFAGRLGRLIEPALRPLGLDWRYGVALIAGFAAKEVVVSSLGTIYSIGNGDERTETNLKQELRNDPMMSPVKAYGLMLFILIYFPCMAALATLKREAGGWKWVVVMIVYTSALAWIVSFMFITIAHFWIQIMT